MNAALSYCRMTVSMTTCIVPTQLDDLIPRVSSKSPSACVFPHATPTMHRPRPPTGRNACVKCFSLFCLRTKASLNCASAAFGVYPRVTIKASFVEERPTDMLPDDGGNTYTSLSAVPLTSNFAWLNRCTSESVAFWRARSYQPAQGHQTGGK